MAAGQPQGSTSGLFPLEPLSVQTTFSQALLPLTLAQEAGSPEGSAWAVLIKDLRSLNTLKFQWCF